MGRKIPGKRHRGVKDPLVQQLTRNESIKHKINAPPVNIDEQPLPESVQRIIQWQQFESKGGNKRKKKKRNTLIDSRKLEVPEILERGMDRPDKPTPAFIQRVGETDKRFLNRVDQMCEEAIKESKINKEINSETTEPDPPSKRRKGDVEAIMTAGGKKQNNKRANDSQHVSKKEKIKLLLTAKKQAKLEKKQEQQDEKMRFRDDVKFGEVVHAPPVLTLPSRNKVTINDARPGQRELILKQLLPSGDQVPSTRPRSQKGKGVKTKMRDLPSAERERLEHNRLQAVQDYRRLKKNKMSRVTQV